MVDYESLTFEYRRASDFGADPAVRHPVVIVGAGPVGLCAALEMARLGHRVVLLDDDHRLSTGSRAICFAKRTLEILDRFGCAERMVQKGIIWEVGRVFLGDSALYQFHLAPEGGTRRPAFINLQQYYFEGFLVEAAMSNPLIDLRWDSKVVALEDGDESVTLSIETPDGPTRVAARYLIACDGSRSSVRRLMGLESHGKTFQDRFLIADVRMKADFPTERWFWFDPPFHRNQSALLHRQPDDVWRIDFQLGWEADPVIEKEPERVRARVRAMLGPDVEFDLQWVSIYTFSCLRMDRYRHGRVFFAGDSAHGVSPFGARGANGGIQDVDNLVWKLATVLEGAAPEGLLDTYDEERLPATDENLLNSTRSTDFITPKSGISRVFRDATLELAREHEFARTLVNSGRLSRPSVLRGSSLNTVDSETFAVAMEPGSACADAPLGGGRWLLDELARGWTVLVFGGAPDDATLAALTIGSASPVTEQHVVIVLSQDAPGAGLHREGVRFVADIAGLAFARYDAVPGTTYLIRPDQHVAGRWRSTDAAAINAARYRAMAFPGAKS